MEFRASTGQAYDNVTCWGPTMLADIEHIAFDVGELQTS